MITNLPFYDVQLNDWYYDSVKDVYSRGYMTGRSKGYFGVAEDMQRQDIAVLIYRMAGSPLIQYQNIYPDVSESSYFAKQQLELSEWYHNRFRMVIRSG